ncbi:hypothetical protein R6Q57_016214 [Mikania cordata]
MAATTPSTCATFLHATTPIHDGIQESPSGHQTFFFQELPCPLAARDVDCFHRVIWLSIRTQYSRGRIPDGIQHPSKSAYNLSEKSVNSFFRRLLQIGNHTRQMARP